MYSFSGGISFQVFWFCCVCDHVQTGEIQVKDTIHWEQGIKWLEKNYLLRKSEVYIKKTKINKNSFWCHWKNDGAWHTQSAMLLYKWCHRSILIASMMSHLCQSDIIEMTFCKTFDNSAVAIVTDLWHHWCWSMAESIKSLKLWWRMAHNVCHASQNFSDFINWNAFNRNLRLS